MITSKEYHQAHHFRSIGHEYSAAKQGMWLFMVTEILMFGGLFVGYAICKMKFPSAFAWGSSHLQWGWGAINTAVLLFSSFTMALAIHYLQKDNVKNAILNLFITFLCGCGFMVIKAIEYTSKFSHHIYPYHLKGAFSDPGHLTNKAVYAQSLLESVFPSGTGELLQTGKIYFGFYFAMTGLHGLHVMIGMGLMLWLIYRCKRGDFSSKNFMAVEGVGLFWHIVDLIWIYLFPMFYLLGESTMFGH